MTRILATLLAVILTTTSATAAEHSWTGAAGDGLWTNSNNWSTKIVPGLFPNNSGGDVAIFENNPRTIHIPDVPGPNSNARNITLGELIVRAPGFTLINENDDGGGFDGFSGFNFTGKGISAFFPFNLVNQSGGDVVLRNNANLGRITYANNTSGMLFSNNSTAIETKIINESTIGIAQPFLAIGSLSSTTADGTVFEGTNINPTVSIGHLNLNDTYRGIFLNFGPGILSVIKDGTGTLVLTNNGHTYTGTTEIRNGTLQFDGRITTSGSLNSRFFVTQNGTLSGTGVIQRFVENQGGVVAPGNPANPFGTLTVFTYSANPVFGGILRINVDPLRSSKLSAINAAGSVITATATSVNPVFTAGRYNNGTTYTIAQAFPGALSFVIGRFNQDLLNVPVRLKPVLTYVPVTSTLSARVDMNVSEVPFGQVMNTYFSDAGADLFSLADAWDLIAVRSNLSDDMNLVIGNLNILQRDAFLNDMRAVGSDLYNAVSLNDFYGMNMVGDLASPVASGWDMNLASTGVNFAHSRECGFTRVASSTDHVATYAFAKPSTARLLNFASRRACPSNAFDRAALELKEHVGSSQRDHVKQVLAHATGKGHLWMQGFGGRVAVETTDKDIGFASSHSGAMLGLDYAVDHDLRLGVGGGYSHSNINFERGMGHTNIESPFISFWGSYKIDDLDLDAALTMRKNQYAMKRRIVFANIDREARSTYRGMSYMPHMGVGYNFWFDCDVHVKPFVALDYFTTRENGAVETGANSLNLDMKRRKASLLQSSIGTSVDRHIKRNCGTLIPLAEFRYMNRANIRRARTNATFVNQGANFISAYQGEQHHRYGVKAELAYEKITGATFKIGYRGDYGREQHSHMGFASVGMKW